MHTKITKIKVQNRLGLHARASVKLAELCSETKIQVELANAHMKIDAKSIMSLLMLAASKGTELELSVTGDAESCEKATADISDLFARKFDEED